MKVRVLTENDAEAFWHFRLRSLENSPEAFGEATEEHRAIPVDTFATRLRDSSNENFVVGAFVEGQLVGTAGFMRIQRVKRKHKGTVWGVYVDPSQRGRRIGQALLVELIHRASTVEGLEQIMLSVAVTQTAAKRLYESLGFETWGREPSSLRYEDNSFDEDHMILRLCK